MPRPEPGPAGTDDLPRPSGRPPSEGRPEVSLPIAAAPQRRPIPRNTIVDHHHGSTTISRLWQSADDAARCRLCPRDRCYVSEGGMCQVTIPGLVPTDLAPLWPLTTPGLPRSTTARLGLWLDRPGSPVADGRTGEG